MFLPVQRFLFDLGFHDSPLTIKDIELKDNIFTGWTWIQGSLLLSSNDVTVRELNTLHFSFLFLLIGEIILQKQREANSMKRVLSVL